MKRYRHKKRGTTYVEKGGITTLGCEGNELEDGEFVFIKVFMHSSSGAFDYSIYKTEEEIMAVEDDNIVFWFKARVQRSSVLPNSQITNWIFYQCEQDGVYSMRPWDEFHDGRFELL